MEERAEYLKTMPRRGKVFVGGYLDTHAAERLRKAADLQDMNMTELLEWLAAQVTVTLPSQACACCHE